jgi:hypothetical protein
MSWVAREDPKKKTKKKDEDLSDQGTSREPGRELFNLPE